MAKGTFWRLAAPAPAAPLAAAAAAGAAAELALFLPESRRDVKPRALAACFWRSFRPSVAWCFGVAKGAPAAPPAAAAAVAAAGAAAAAGPAAELAFFFKIQKGRQASGQHGFRPSVAWCFSVAKSTFWELAAPAPAAAAAAAAAGPAAEPALFFARIQKGRQVSG